MTKTIKFDLDGDIAVLTIDLPGKSMNVITEEMMQDLETLIGKVIGDSAIKGAVITSGKPAFVAGADLSMMSAMSAMAKTAPIEETFKFVLILSNLLRRMETSGKPFAAAINGLAMGGGLEICLACHYRVVADDPKIQLGLPEVKVGLLPGAGGTQRLPRLMGVQAALPYLLQGRSMSPQEAAGFGVVHKVVAKDALLAEAKRWVREEGNAVQPWDQKNFKFPGGSGAMNVKVVQTFMAGEAMLRKETKDNYPAPQAIMNAVYEGHQVPMDAALRIECRYFTTLILRPESTNMIRTLFLNKQSADKLVRRPKNVAKAEIKKLGVLGAGMMGAGIAYVSAMAGMEVALLDMTQEAASKGKAYSVGLLEKDVRRGKLSREKADAALNRITPTTDYAQLAGCDLIIEAVFEDAKIKADVTAKTEAVMPKSAIFASNTSTLPITELAKASKRPAQFIGIHFFSPVEKMPLVEIIMGKKTGEEALARALDYVAQIRKTPIVVNDSRGFYTSRCFGTYPSEAIAMLKEGINPALIENAGVMAGMPVGPFAVADEVSIELMYKVMKATRAAVGDKYQEQPADSVAVDFVEKFGRLGKKAKKGFYEYPEDGKKYLWPELAKHFPRADNQPTVEEVKKRLLYRQAVEVARCYEEGVLTAPEDADIGAIFGWGFAPYTGGPLSMIDTVGVAAFVKETERMARAYGARYRSPKLLRDMAKEGRTFYAG
ncbi:MAG: 3-hydroxyacyl-CoA dehydrogenase [Proteobacteria bacterium]|nr:MAG: 3-hydroxyacyl-CoA dehydrogenase [Pseudomonadota bacterium]